MRGDRCEKHCLASVRVLFKLRQFHSLGHSFVRRRRVHDVCTERSKKIQNAPELNCLDLSHAFS